MIKEYLDFLNAKIKEDYKLAKQKDLRYSYNSFEDIIKEIEYLQTCKFELRIEIYKVDYILRTLIDEVIFLRSDSIIDYRYTTMIINEYTICIEHLRKITNIVESKVS